MKYSYGPESLLQRVEIVRTETGAKRAYLEAAPNADVNKLGQVREALAKHGYITVPIEMAGKPYLEVRKFTNAESLLKQLQETGAVNGTPTQVMAVQDKIGVWQWIKNNTFKACLVMYGIGDIGYMIYARFRDKFTDGAKAEYQNSENKRFKLSPPTPSKNSAFIEFSNQASSYGYAAGTAASAISTYLRGDQSDEEVYKISKNIGEKLDSAAISKRSTAFQALNEQQPHSIGGRIKEVFIKFPAEVLNSCYGFAGFFMMAFNLKKEIPHAKTEIKFLSEEVAKAKHALDIVPGSPYLKAKHGLLEQKLNSTKGALKVYRQDVLLGSITLLSGLFSTLVKEKPKHPDEKEPDGFFAKAWRWLQEKPLRIAATGYLVSTGIHLLSTLKDYSRIKGDHDFANEMGKSSNIEIKALSAAKLEIAAKEARVTHGRMVFVVTNLIAEVLMGFSSKGHGEGVKSDATVETSATAIAAENIALQAPEKREELVEQMSKQLADPKVMGGSSALIARNLRANLKSLASNPWADTVRQQQADATKTATLS